jgi:hypothetical protein
MDLDHCIPELISASYSSSNELNGRLFFANVNTTHRFTNANGALLNKADEPPNPGVIECSFWLMYTNCSSLIASYFGAFFAPLRNHTAILTRAATDVLRLDSL